MAQQIEVSRRYSVCVYTHFPSRFIPGIAIHSSVIGKKKRGRRNPSPDITCLIFFTPFHEYLGGFSREWNVSLSTVG